MKPFPIVVACCLLAACYRGGPTTGDAAPADAVTLQFDAPRVGQRWTEVHTAVWDFVAAGDGERVPGAIVRVSKRAIEVLEVTGDAESRARHTYAVDHERMAAHFDDGSRDEEEHPTAIHGKTYVLAAGSPTHITTDTGDAAPEDEATIVRERAERFGKPDPMRKVLVGKTLIKDKPYALSSTEMAKYDDSDGMKLTRYVITFRSRRGTRGVFDVTSASAGIRDGIHMSFELTGRYVVDLETGTDLEYDLSGPLKTRRDRGVINGRMRITLHRTL